MNRNRVFAGLLAAGLTAAVGWTQQAPPEKTPQAGDEKATGAKESGQEAGSAGRRNQTWSEFVADTLTPKPYPKEAVVFIDEKYAYPHVVASIKMEIVRVDGDTVWLKGLPPENPESPLYKIWAKRQAEEALTAHRAEVARAPGAQYFLDFAAEPVPPPFMNSLLFEPAGQDLPDVGRWQMGFAVADMNGDGHPDLVFPPQRKAIPPRPSIFLGDGKGGFRFWQQAEWPAKVPFDYGGVAVDDFNGDGHQDLVIAVHFKAQYLLYGDGRGGFQEFQRLPSLDPRVSSRAVTAADFSGDGRPDLAFVAEIDFDMSTNAPIEGASTVWVLVNQGKTWKIESEGLPRNIIADVIRSTDLDADGRPDLILSSNAVNRRRLAFLNRGGDGWKSAQHRGVLSSAYHFDAEPAGDEIFSTFVQFRMISGSTEARNGLIRYRLIQAGEDFVNGQPLIWDADRGNPFFRLAAGDLDGDGLTDLIAGRKGGGLEVYLQNETGEFVKEEAAELADTGRVFDIRLLDLDGDGYKDIVAGFTPQGGVEGGIHVWLTRPAA